MATTVTLLDLDPVGPILVMLGGWRVTGHVCVGCMYSPSLPQPPCWTPPALPHTCTHTHTHAHAHTQAHTQAHTYTHAHTERHTHMHTHQKKQSHTHAVTHTHTCTCTPILDPPCPNTHVHSRAHMCTPLSTGCSRSAKVDVGAEAAGKSPGPTGNRLKDQAGRVWSRAYR